MVHQRFVLELSFETAGIANAVPRLDADEGRLLAERTPEGDDGGAECDSHLWIATST